MQLSSLYLLCSLCIFRYKYYSPTPHQAHNPNNHGRALLSAPPQAIAPNPHTTLLNVQYMYGLQMKWGFNKKKNAGALCLMLSCYT
jgi:hypothetical protein